MNQREAKQWACTVALGTLLDQIEHGRAWEDFEDQADQIRAERAARELMDELSRRAGEGLYRAHLRRRHPLASLEGQDG